MKPLSYVLSALFCLSMTQAYANDTEKPDTRSSWAKSQDMYIQPTLRISEILVPITKEEAEKSNLAVKYLTPGSAVPSVTTTIIGPDGQVLQKTATRDNIAPPIVNDAVQEPVNPPLVTPKQHQPKIKDLSRMMPR